MLIWRSTFELVFVPESFKTEAGVYLSRESVHAS